MMSHSVGLGRRIASGAVYKAEWRRTSAGRSESSVVTSLRVHIGLIHCGPILNPVSELSKAHIGIFNEVLPEQN